MDEKQKALDILNKFSFILGQRAGRELWFDKPEKVQDEDLSNFNEDIEYIKHYIKNIEKAIMTKENDIEKDQNQIKFQQSQIVTRENDIKKLTNKLFLWKFTIL